MLFRRRAIFEVIYFAVDQESRSEHNRETEAQQKPHNLSKTQKSHFRATAQIHEDLTPGAALCWLNTPRRSCCIWCPVQDLQQGVTCVPGCGNNLWILAALQWPESHRFVPWDETLRHWLGEGELFPWEWEWDPPLSGPGSSFHLNFSNCCAQSAIYQVRRWVLPHPCGAYDHSAVHGDWKSWTHQDFKDGNESNIYMSPWQVSLKRIWIKKGRKNWGCLETQWVHTSALNSADSHRLR